MKQELARERDACDWLVGHIMAVGDAHVFPGFLTPVLTQISLQSHRQLFSHASAEVRGENMPVRNFTSTRSRTHNHQVMSLTTSPLSHPGGCSCRMDIGNHEGLRWG